MEAEMYAFKMHADLSVTYIIMYIHHPARQTAGAAAQVSPSTLMKKSVEMPADARHAPRTIKTPAANSMFRTSLVANSSTCTITVTSTYKYRCSSIAA